jgi:hypothetical protein
MDNPVPLGDRQYSFYCFAEVAVLDGRMLELRIDPVLTSQVLTSQVLTSQALMSQAFLMSQALMSQALMSQARFPGGTDPISSQINAYLQR